MDVVLQLVQLLLGVAIVGSFVRGLLPRGSATASVWARRRAEWLSAGFALLAAYLLAVVVRALTRTDGPDPRGVIPFLVLAAVVGVALPVLRGVWRRARAEAAEERAAGAVPAHEAPRRHRGLSGEETPPTRW